MNQPIRRQSWGATSPRPPQQPPLQQTLNKTGRIYWNPEEITLPHQTPRDITHALARFKLNLNKFIWNAAALEGNTFTLPEVITLLDGVTVGGKKLEDEEQILALSEGYNLLAESVEEGSFTLSRNLSNSVHALVARHEAIEAGNFRGEGTVTGGGIVRLTDGSRVNGDEAGEQLLMDYENLLVALSQIADPRMRAMIYFCSATRSQFYFDGNKRTARLMMAGELMAHGYDAINIPYARKLEFNQCLDELFTTDNATSLLNFLISCLID